jgi:hypothetical protein
LSRLGWYRQFDSPSNWSHQGPRSKKTGSQFPAIKNDSVAELEI